MTLFCAPSVHLVRPRTRRSRERYGFVRWPRPPPRARNATRSIPYGRGISFRFLLIVVSLLVDNGHPLAAARAAKTPPKRGRRTSYASNITAMQTANLLRSEHFLAKIVNTGALSENGAPSAGCSPGRATSSLVIGFVLPHI